MKVLFLFWGGGEGGDASSLIALAKAVKEHSEFEFEIVAYAATHPEVFRGKAETAGLTCHLISDPERVWEESGLRNTDFDLIHVHHGRSIPKRTDIVPLRKVARGLPLVITVHGPLPLRSINYGGWKSQLSRKLAGRWFDAVIVPSDAKLREWREFTPFNRNVVAIANVVSFMTPVDKIVARGSMGLPQKADVVLFCSRLDEEKDPLTFVRAIALAAHKRPSIRGIMAGSGELAEKTASLICELEAPVKLLGYVDDLNAAYSAADVFVQPSLYESFCVTLLQAAEIGLSCVATDLDVFKDFYQDLQNFEWFETSDAKSCAEGILAQVDVGEVAARHSLRDRFSEETIVREHVNLWQSLTR